jgi:phage FluMu gp28-like protein
MPSSTIKTARQPAIHLLATQKRWMLDKSRFKAGMFTRQGGKTFVASLETVDDVLTAEAMKLRSPWLIVSRGERQAEMVIREHVERHLHAYDIMLKSISEEVVEFFDEDKIKRRGLELRFSKDNYITALPANPDTIPGYSANMLFDEFALHKDSRKIWTSAFPIISRGKKARIISSPRGKGNKFYEIMTDASGTWSHYLMDIYQAVKEGAPLNIEELRRGLMDEDAWAQEYELQWLDEASSWLSYDLINSCEHDHAGIPEHYMGGPCFVGVDIATRSDNFVIWVDELIGDVLWTREVIVKKRISFAEMDALQDDVEQRYKVARYCMDQTGMGEKPVEDAKRRYGQHRVEGVLFTGASKLQLATLIKQTFEDRKSRIPMADEKLRADLHRVRKITSPTGAPRFDADSDANGHADRFWAKALACLAAHGVSGPVHVASATAGKTRPMSEQLDGYLT